MGAGGPSAAPSGGAQRALARALSAVERGGTAAEEVLRGLGRRPPAAHTVGITGAPGVGKSTLIQALGTLILEGGSRLAVLAMDPSSPFSGGALLGDRVRMPELAARGAYVRSMATRGALGGIAGATADAITVLAAANYDWIIVETVGIGQDEVDVAGEVDTVAIVSVAGLGDDVQAAKAGLLEIGDVFLVNKADRPGADLEAELLTAMLALKPPSGWTPPVIRVSALSGDGMEDALAAVHGHQRFLSGGDRQALVRRRRAVRRLERSVAEVVWRQVQRDRTGELERLVGEVTEGRLDPYSAARVLLEGRDAT
jgi:GTPase